MTLTAKNLLKLCSRGFVLCTKAYKSWKQTGRGLTSEAVYILCYFRKQGVPFDMYCLYWWLLTTMNNLRGASGTRAVIKMSFDQPSNHRSNCIYRWIWYYKIIKDLEYDYGEVDLKSRHTFCFWEKYSFDAFQPGLANYFYFYWKMEGRMKRR